MEIFDLERKRALRLFEAALFLCDENQVESLLCSSWKMVSYS